MPIPHALFDFLSDLADNNDRDWFNANKSRYDRDVKEPALRLVADFEEQLHAISPHFLAIPRAQGGSLFRIYRDTRFSADKTPYKTNSGMQFRHEAAGGDVHAPGFYLHLEPGKSGVGVGIWQPPNPVLNRVRDRIVAEPEVFGQIDRDLAAQGLSWFSESLSRPPRGYAKDHVHVDALKRKSVAVSRDLTDAQVCADDFADTLAAAFQAGAPLVRFVCQALDLPF